MAPHPGPSPRDELPREGGALAVAALGADEAHPKLAGDPVGVDEGVADSDFPALVGVFEPDGGFARDVRPVDLAEESFNGFDEVTPDRVYELDRRELGFTLALGPLAQGDPHVGPVHPRIYVGSY